MQRSHPLPHTLPGWLAFIGVVLLLALMAYALSTYAIFASSARTLPPTGSRRADPAGEPSTWPA